MKVFLLSFLTGCLILSSATIVLSQQKVFDIASFGAVPDGRTNNTKAIQKAIDKAASAGGGRVNIPAGRYLTGVLHLLSGVELHLEDRAVLLGSTKRTDYGKEKASCLILADHQRGIAITGKGAIDGQGREVVKDVFRMLQAGTLRDPEWQTENPWRQKRPIEANRPGLIDFRHCDSVIVSAVTLKDAACWVQTYTECTNLLIDSIRVESTAYWNNDGIDIVDCRKARISHCFVNAADDGICLKSHSADRFCDSITVSDCTVRSSASAVKFGTASRGGFRNIIVKNIRVYDTYRSAIALESVDGGFLEDVLVQGIRAENTGNAFFIRLGRRARELPPGRIRNVVIRDMTVDIPEGKPDKGYGMEGPALDYPHNGFPASITGLPGYPVQQVSLENISIRYAGGGRKDRAAFGTDSLAKVPEKEGDYPEFSMFGELPAWGLYARHATGISLKNITISHKRDDYRPAMVADDVQGLVMHDMNIPAEPYGPGITVTGIREHIAFLSADANRGRYPGTPESDSVVRYITGDFKKNGIGAFGDDYLQPFTAKLRVRKGVTDTPYVKTGNVIGLIRGCDPVLQNEYIILGAHYDHLGMGGPSSKKPDTIGIHHGADDNASGTAALLEIGEKLSANRDLLKRSVILIAFGAEEQGLLGSKYFAEHPIVPLEQIKLMINMDMVGRLNEQKQVHMGGAGTFPGGMVLMKELGKAGGLDADVHAGDVGGSDHVSFYKKKVPVIGLHTGGHPQYHTPEDTVDLINLPGEKAVCEYIYEAILRLSARPEPITFIDQH